MAEAHNNLAIALDMRGEYAQSLRHIQFALRIKPDFALAHLNRAIFWLRNGDFEEGWHEFEWRRVCDCYYVPKQAVPLWDGEPLPEGTIMLHAEQGMGDTLQFVRYAQLVKQRCSRVMVQCQKPLEPILRGCPGVDQLVPPGVTLPDHQAQISLMSLPFVLGTTLETIPADVPYLFADPTLVETWKERLKEHAGFKIGIAWQGNPDYRGDMLRSIPLRSFQPVANLSGVKLISLQKGKGTEQLREFVAKWPILDLGPEVDTVAGAFMDTAAIMRNLDLVITSDTAIAHLAGALGVAVWLALPVCSDWRWLLNREDSPWYPTMRLFRQSQSGNWEEVFSRIEEELRKVLHGDTSRRNSLMQSWEGSRSTATRPASEECAHLPTEATFLASASGFNSPGIAEGYSGTTKAVEKDLPRVAVSMGELLDKVSILTIKSMRMSDREKVKNIENELAELKPAWEQVLGSHPTIASLFAELTSINETLWDIENEIRICEANNEFGARFIELARAVYQTNDRRVATKRRIDCLSGSRLVEEKDYLGREVDSTGGNREN